MKLSIALLATAASAAGLKEYEVQELYFNDEPIVSPATRSNKQWHECGEKPQKPTDAHDVQCSGAWCRAICPLGSRNSGRWRIKCMANNTWSASKFGSCVTCPDLTNELRNVIEANNGVAYQQDILSGKGNLVKNTQFFCGKDTDSLTIKGKLFVQGGIKRNVKCQCKKGRNGDPKWKKSCGWEWMGQPFTKSDVNNAVSCDTKSKYCKLDEKMDFPLKYNYKKVDSAAHFKDYFRISSDFKNNIHLGFSNGFNNHDDEKWEIVIGGWFATKHVIRNGNQVPKNGLVSQETTKAAYEQLREDFIVQVTDGSIAVYQSDSGRKGALVIELNDQKIKKSELNTLVASGGSPYWGGKGYIQFNGVGCI